MNPVKYYRRKQAADYLTQAGLPVAVATLAKLAVVGGGPQFQKWGRYPVYSEKSLDSWASERLGRPMRSTSDIAPPTHAPGIPSRPVPA